MIALSLRFAARVLAAFGWRGAVGLAIGAVVATVPAYQAGKWTESAAAEARVEAALAKHRIETMERHNDRIDAAYQARLRSDRISRDNRDAGGMPNDGYRRD